MFCKLFYRVLNRVLFSFCRKIQIKITYFNHFKYFSIFYRFQLVKSYIRGILEVFYRVFQMVFFYQVYIRYIGGTLYSGNFSIGYCIRYCIRYLKGYMYRVF